MIYYKIIKSPVGDLKLVANENSLIAVLWENDNSTRGWLAPLERDENHFILCETERQLNDYFSGRLKKFSLPLHFSGTEFQKKVWDALTTIPFGETRSYGQIAKQINHAKAVRAVGAANGRNAISIVVPCHRVIGANGRLTGFAGGLKNKAILLEIESK